MSHLTQITEYEGVQTLAAAPAPGVPISDMLGNGSWLSEIAGPVGIGAAAGGVLVLTAFGWMWKTYSPRPGFASKSEIRREMSAKHATAMAAQTRPSLAGQLKEVPITDYAVPLGRLVGGGWPVSIYGTPEQNYVILAPSRQGKSIILNSLIYRWAGAVVHTSSKISDHLATRDLRELLGPVWVWDPLGLSGGRNLNTFRWDPVRGCDDRSVAIQRAAYLLYGSRGAGNPGAGVDEFFRSTACEVLARYLNAAALGGKTMMDVYSWSMNRADGTAANILIQSGAEKSWSDVLVSRQKMSAQNTADGIFTTLSAALGWMANPTIAATVLPGPGEHFEAEAFLQQRGTLYMVGSDKPGSEVAPLFVMFADYLRSVSVDLGNASGHGRLDPPCLWALDEVANIVPLPIDRWMTDSGGRGITLVLVFQSRAQLYSVWGQERGRVVWDDANVRIVLRGIGDKAVRDDISAMCGTYKHVRKTTTTSDGKTSVSSHEEVKTVISQDEIFKLGRRQSLIIFAGCSPVITRIKPLWERRDVRKLRKSAGIPQQRKPGKVRVLLRKRKR
ncbi:type IV secretory system conjugative DNA transfer family protein [Streptomyces vinaceus]